MTGLDIGARQVFVKIGYYRAENRVVEVFEHMFAAFSSETGSEWRVEHIAESGGNFFRFISDITSCCVGDYGVDASVGFADEDGAFLKEECSGALVREVEPQGDSRQRGREHNQRPARSGNINSALEKVSVHHVEFFYIRLVVC